MVISESVEIVFDRLPRRSNFYVPDFFRIFGFQIFSLILVYCLKTCGNQSIDNTLMARIEIEHVCRTIENNGISKKTKRYLFFALFRIRG